MGRSPLYRKGSRSRLHFCNQPLSLYSPLTWKQPQAWGTVPFFFYEGRLNCKADVVACAARSRMSEAGRGRLCCRRSVKGMAMGIGLQSGFVIGVVIAALLLADRLGGAAVLALRGAQLALALALVMLVLAATATVAGPFEPALDPFEPSEREFREEAAEFARLDSVVGTVHATVAITFVPLGAGLARRSRALAPAVLVAGVLVAGVLLLSAVPDAWPARTPRRSTARSSPGRPAPGVRRATRATSPAWPSSARASWSSPWSFTSAGSAAQATQERRPLTPERRLPDHSHWPRRLPRCLSARRFCVVEGPSPTSLHGRSAPNSWAPALEHALTRKFFHPTYRRGVFP